MASMVRASAALAVTTDTGGRIHDGSAAGDPTLPCVQSDECRLFDASDLTTPITNPTSKPFSRKRHHDADCPRSIGATQIRLQTPGQTRYKHDGSDDESIEKGKPGATAGWKDLVEAIQDRHQYDHPCKPFRQTYANLLMSEQICR